MYNDLKTFCYTFCTLFYFKFNMFKANIVLVFCLCHHANIVKNSKHLTNIGCHQLVMMKCISHQH